MNPYLPRLRAKACQMVVREGKSIRAVARYYGVHASTVSRWVQQYPEAGAWKIATKSSRPKSHPKKLNSEIVDCIVQKRKKRGRCAEVIHEELKNDGIEVSLSSVKRTLDRKGLTKKKSPWKRFHKNTERPRVALPGDLVQMDTIHMMQTRKKRIYVYTLIDLYSRWSFAEASEKIGAVRTVDFVRDAQDLFPHEFTCLQSDYGPEFGQRFSEWVGVRHRHSRVRKPNDNAHVERFNRTIQDELLDSLPRNVSTINEALPEYLKYYNEERLHMGIEMKTPLQMLEKIS